MTKKKERTECRYRYPASGVICRRKPDSPYHEDHTTDCRVPASSHHPYQRDLIRQARKPIVRVMIYLDEPQRKWLKRNGGISQAIRVLISAAMGTVPRVHVHPGPGGMTPDEAVYQFLEEKGALAGTVGVDLARPGSERSFITVLNADGTTSTFEHSIPHQSSPDDDGLVV